MKKLLLLLLSAIMMTASAQTIVPSLKYRPSSSGVDINGVRHPLARPKPIPDSGKKEKDTGLALIYSGQPIYPFWSFPKNQPAIDTFNNYVYSNNKLSSLQNMSTQLGKNSFVGAEFANFFFGIARLGVGGYFQATGDTAADNKTKASLQKILAAGGNLSLNLTAPFWICRSYNEQNHLAAFLFTTVGIGSRSNFAVDSAIGLTGQTGFIFHADFASNANTGGALFALDVPISYVYGTKSQMADLGLPDFGMVQVKASLTINNLLTFYAQYPIVSSSKIINNNFRQLTGGIQFSPGQILKAKTN